MLVPQISYFHIVGTARIVRADNGTENSNIAAMQRLFRREGTDSMAGQKSFLFGKSNSNQVNLIFKENLHAYFCFFSKKANPLL